MTDSDIDTDDEVIERSRKRKRTTAPAFTVEVTPIAVAANNEVICEIDVPAGASHKYVKGGLIKLPVAGQPFTMAFQLMAGVVPNLEFDPNDPFWSGPTCPTAAGNDLRLTPNTPCGPTSLDVDVRPQPPKDVIYYRLNFTDGTNNYYFDPIIVNN